MEHYGVLSLIPVFVVVIAALLTRRTVESMLLGATVGFVILSGTGFFMSTIDAFYVVLADPVSIWIVMLVFLFGALVSLFERSGSTENFGKVAIKVATGPKKTLFLAWFLGLVVFADDYLNVLSVGVAIRRIADKFKIAREFLAFIISSAGAGICVLIPFTTWSAYMMGLMGGTGVIDKADAFSTYVSSIPFMLYAAIAYLMVPLFILKIVPTIGPMRKSQQRALETGQTLPDSTVKEFGGNDLEEVKSEDEPKKANALTFLLPLLVLAGVTIYAGDLLVGIIVALFLTIAIVAVQRIMKPGVLCDSIIDGMKDMLYPNMIIMFAFVLQQANEGLGLTPFVIETVQPIMSPALFPAVVFLVISALAFGTGSFWGIAAVAFPIILPLAQALDVNIYLSCGALIAGTVFGSKACFFGDCATLVCVATQIKNPDFLKNVVPVILIPFSISLIVYLIIGFIMA